MKMYRVVEVGAADYQIIDRGDDPIARFTSKYEADADCETLNRNCRVVCYSYASETVGSEMLSAFFSVGYQLLSHAVGVQDGMMVNSVILHKQPRGEQPV